MGRFAVSGRCSQCYSVSGTDASGPDWGQSNEVRGPGDWVTMGIKFRCPNGHKLNVKSFLAGKRGVCPDCQATFRIPAEPGGSDVRAMALPSLKGGNGTAAAEAPLDADPEPVLTTTAMVTSATAVAPSPVIAASAVPVTTVQAAPRPAAVPVGTVAPTPAVIPVTVSPVGPTAAAVGDPIAESPAAIWYVRPPSGGQYGPARGEVMRKWIAEGRVSGDSLVWREGWTDWRSAGSLFASLGQAAANSPAAGPAVAVAVPAAPRTAARYAARKKGGSGMAIAALVGLVLVCVVLVAVLVVVLAQQAA